MALDEAKIDPSAVDYINAHGTGTRHNDWAETRAIKAVFGERDSLWVSSNKSMTGHMLGAAGAVEVAACAQTLKTGVVPPTINYDQPDPACDLDFVPNVARERNIQYAMSNSFGFGGANACLVLKRFT